MKMSLKKVLAAVLALRLAAVREPAAALQTVKHLK